MGFSVLMSIYKKETPSYFNDALKSIINQTIKCDEIVVVKDGPITDELNMVLSKWEKTAQKLGIAIVTYQFEENVQLGRALAQGVLLCSNDIIARMDTDDIAVNNRFYIQYRYLLEHSDIAVVGGLIKEFSDFGKCCVKQMPETEGAIRKYSRYRNPLNHMTVMFRKKDILESGNYHHFPLLEDYDLWNRMLATGKKFYNIQTVLVYARTGDSQYSRRSGYQYFLSHKQLRSGQLRLGLLNRKQYMIALSVSLLFALMPVWAKRMAYRYCLSRKDTRGCNEDCS